MLAIWLALLPPAKRWRRTMVSELTNTAEKRRRFSRCRADTGNTWIAIGWHANLLPYHLWPVNFGREAPRSTNPTLLRHFVLQCPRCIWCCQIRSRWTVRLQVYLYRVGCSRSLTVSAGRKSPCANPYRCLVLCWVITVFGLSTARAANIFWDGTGTSWNAASFWSTAGNATTPDPAAKPGAGDIANFNISTVNSAQTVNLDACGKWRWVWSSAAPARF